jgi:hypothetical protein
MVLKGCHQRLLDKIHHRQIYYHKPGNKPHIWKEQEEIQRMEDQYEAEGLEISLSLQSFDPTFPPHGPLILKPVLHVQPCPECDKFGHKSVYCP